MALALPQEEPFLDEDVVPEVDDIPDEEKEMISDDWTIPEGGSEAGGYIDLSEVNKIMNPEEDTPDVSEEEPFDWFAIFAEKMEAIAQEENEGNFE